MSTWPRQNLYGRKKTTIWNLYGTYTEKVFLTVFKIMFLTFLCVFKLFLICLFVIALLRVCYFLAFAIVDLPKYSASFPCVPSTLDVLALQGA